MAMFKGVFKCKGFRRFIEKLALAIFKNYAFLFWLRNRKVKKRGTYYEAAFI